MEIITENGKDVTLNPNMKIKEYPQAVVITTQANWYTRLWYLISNPIMYIVIGKIRW